MKKYTHAWLAYMAIKRLKDAEMTAKNRKLADELVDWFLDHKDFVVQGAWYPDSIIKDMATSHVLKYKLLDAPNDIVFEKLPAEYEILTLVKNSNIKKRAFTIDSGNLPDRCEAIAHSIIDNLKILESEPKGSPIAPTNNHIVTLFFMLSHYIADAHMPLHCDARSFSSGDNIHAAIEEQWDEAIKLGYEIDEPNERFKYDIDGFPAKKVQAKMPAWLSDVDAKMKSRKFNTNWGTGNNNTWDFMKAITQHSYLMAYELIPEGYNEKNLNWKKFIELQTKTTFEESSKLLFTDAIDSIAKVWFRVWNKYKNWEE